MSLEDFFEVDESPEVKQTIKEKIRQRRSQMLVHSCIYYELDDSIVSDNDWQRWANELVELHKKYPKHRKIGFFDREFSTWDGSSGYHLPHRHPWVYNKAQQLLKHSQENS